MHGVSGLRSQMDRHFAGVWGGFHLVSRPMGLQPVLLLKLQCLASAWCADVLLCSNVQRIVALRISSSFMCFQKC